MENGKWKMINKKNENSKMTFAHSSSLAEEERISTRGTSVRNSRWRVLQPIACFVPSPIFPNAHSSHWKNSPSARVGVHVKIPPKPFF